MRKKRSTRRRSKFGDLAVVEVLNTLEPHVASLHLSAFDGGKMSLATMLIPPKAWAESLAYFAATWDEDWIEDEPEVLAESLFAHIHGVVFSTDDEERRAELLHEALATDWGTTAFAVLFSTAAEEIIEIANDIHNLGAHRSGQTTSDHDVIPLALEIARSNEDAWDRVLFEIFPDWKPGENELHAGSEEGDDDEDRNMNTRWAARPRNCCCACAGKCRAKRPARRKKVHGRVWARIFLSDAY